MPSDQKIVLNNFAFLVLVSFFIFGLSFSSINESEAASTTNNKYGQATKSKICGDRLCVGGADTTKKSNEPRCFSSRVQVSCDKLKFMPVEEKKIEKINLMEEIANARDAKVSDYSTKVNVPVTIPLHQGYYNGKAVYYIITDSSDKTHADIISNNQGWKVNLAPPLANASKSALSKTYMFTNGVKGNGVHGFQGEVFTSTPAQPNVYSALTSHVHVTWDDAATPIILDSENAVLQAEKKGLVTLSKLNVVLNMPQIVWPGGQMPVKSDKLLTDKTPFVGGQVLDINLKNMTTTFIARQGWDAHGNTIYYIITDTTPIGPAISLGVTNAPNNAVLATSSSTADLFHFMNGINGTGPLGFQSGIVSSVPGDPNYSPMWKIYFVAWNNPDSASLLQTKKNIDSFFQVGRISINLAKPMSADHIVNAPIIDPFQ